MWRAPPLATTSRPVTGLLTKVWRVSSMFSQLNLVFLVYWNFDCYHVSRCGEYEVLQFGWTSVVFSLYGTFPCRNEWFLSSTSEGAPWKWMVLWSHVSKMPFYGAGCFHWVAGLHYPNRCICELTLSRAFRFTCRFDSCSTPCFQKTRKCILVSLRAMSKRFGQSPVCDARLYSLSFRHNV